MAMAPPTIAKYPKVGFTAIKPNPPINENMPPISPAGGKSAPPIKANANGPTTINVINSKSGKDI